MKLSLYVCEMCGKDYATSPYTRGIEEGRRQMREEAVQVLRKEVDLGCQTDDYTRSWIANIRNADLEAIQAIPLKKEPTP